MAYGIAELRAHLDLQLRQILERFDDLKGVLKTMPTDADLQAAIAASQAAVVQAVTDASTRFTNDINALKAQIAVGGTVSQSDLDALAASQTAELAAIAALDPAPAPAPGP